MAPRYRPRYMEPCVPHQKTHSKLPRLAEKMGVPSATGPAAGTLPSTGVASEG